MDDVAQRLGRTFGVCTAQGRLIFHVRHRRTARGARLRHLEHLRIRSMLYYSHHFRNDIPRLAHADHIPDADAKLPDEILVVQDSPGNGRSRQQHRFKHSRRRQHACAPDRNLDIQ